MFKLIRERIVGMLPAKENAQWAKLMARRDRIICDQHKFEVALDKFTAKLEKVIPPPPDMPEHKSYKISKEGELSQVLCECPPCQAKLHGLTITQTVDAMVQEELIRRDRIRPLKQEAAMLDAKQINRCSYRSQLN